MRWLLPFFGLSLIAPLGCTTPCDESRVVLTRRCMIEVGGESEVACEGERRAYAECILEHPDEACAYFYDPVVATGNAFDVCVAAIPPD